MSCILFARFSSFELFPVPKLKKWLSDQRFSKDEEVMSAANGYFEEQRSSHYTKGIELIGKSVKGDYVKNKYFF